MKATTLVFLAITAALAASIQRRAVIAHDAVVGFSQTVPSGTVGELYLKYKPYLKVENGCVPFPAVDASGNTGYEANDLYGAHKTLNTFPAVDSAQQAALTMAAPAALARFTHDPQLTAALSPSCTPWVTVSSSPLPLTN